MRFLLSITIFVFFIATARSQQSEGLEKLVEKYCGEYLEQNQGLAVGIIDGQNQYQFYLGNISPNNGRLPKENDLFEMGSLTKVLTASIILQLELEGILTLSDPIVKYLPDSVKQNPNLNDLRIENLLNHSSGLGKLPNNLWFNTIDPKDKYGAYFEKQLMASLMKFKPRNVEQSKNKKKKSAYQYSHWAYGVLGYIAEKASGSTFEELCQNRIRSFLKEDEIIDEVIPGHLFNGIQAKAQHYQAMSSSLGMKMTLPQFMTFIQFNLEANEQDENLFKQSLWKCQQESLETDYARVSVGYGWHLVKRRKKDPLIISHSGKTEGFRSYTAFIRESDKGTASAVVLFSNSSSDLDELGFDLLELINR